MTQSSRSAATHPSTDPAGSPSFDHTGNGWGAGYGQATPDAPTGTLPVVPRESTLSDPAPAHAAGAANPTTGQRPAGRASRSRGPRRARLQLRHIDPWTVLKFSCVLSIALFLVWLIVVGVLFGILDSAGIIGKINHTFTLIQGGSAKPPVTAGVVFGAAAIIGVVDIVLFIALSTIGSLVYNLCADLVGGVEVTLSER